MAKKLFRAIWKMWVAPDIHLDQKLGGVSDNTLSNIIYKIKVLQELKNCRSLRKHYQVLCDDWLMVMI